ncbi:MAG: cytidine deaminase [Desulfurococcales archaeon]|nr:cytidine deaminase [Desulfurococcales archaeon]
MPEDLLKEAVKASENAYAPYSGFHVGAAVRTCSGRVYSGANVENSSYGLTVCAERVAVFTAVSSGERCISEVLVYFRDSDYPLPPCGACLQVLSEFSEGDAKVYMVGRGGSIRVARLRELLPEGFRLTPLKRG